VQIVDDSITLKSTHQKEYRTKSTKERIEEFYKTDFETAVKENDYDFEIVNFVPAGDEIW